jgi:hypothetical protein
MSAFDFDQSLPDPHQITHRYHRGSIFFGRELPVVAQDGDDLLDTRVFEKTPASGPALGVRCVDAPLQVDGLGGDVRRDRVAITLGEIAVEKALHKLVFNVGRFPSIPGMSAIARKP